MKNLFRCMNECAELLCIAHSSKDYCLVRNAAVIEETDIYVYGNKERVKIDEDGARSSARARNLQTTCRTKGDGTIT
jgi:hypothetical protein